MTGSLFLLKSKVCRHTPSLSAALDRLPLHLRIASIMSSVGTFVLTLGLFDLMPVRLLPFGKLMCVSMLQRSYVGPPDIGVAAWF